MIVKQWIRQSVCCGGCGCLSRLDKSYLDPIQKIVSNSTPERVRFSSIKQFSLLPILMLAGILAGCGGVSNGGDGGANPPSPLAAPNTADASEQTASDDATATTASGDAPTDLARNNNSLRISNDAQISTGGNRTYAITSTRQLFGWGSNLENQLGLGNSGSPPPSISAPTLLTGNGWRQISAGNKHTCAINASKQLWCWGNGGSGRLGLGNNNSTNIPTRVGSASNWVRVSAGRSHTCAINASRRLFCWGVGGDGRLGLGNNNGIKTPTRVDGNAYPWTGSWIQVSAGAFHTCAIDTSRQLWCWGKGGSGRLGLGNNNSSNRPGRVGFARDWKQVSAGRSHTCAIQTSGRLWCWGVGGDGRLGLGNNNSTSTPTLVDSTSHWTQVSAGDRHTCAIRAHALRYGQGHGQGHGQLLCWGDGGSGQLGLGNNDDTNTPARVGVVGDWSQVSAGDRHTCAKNVYGQLSCWGDGANGQLGLGNYASANTPALVPGIALKMIELSLALNSNVGLPFAIANTGGNPTICTAAPTINGGRALDFYNLTVRAAGGTCVIDSLNGNGPSRTLGRGSFTITASNGATATLTLNLHGPTTPQIVTRNGETYAINSAGQLFAWGSNHRNRLGLDDPENSPPSVSTPTLLTGNDWAQVSGGGSLACGIKTSGQLWCWGAHGFSLLDHQTTYRTVVNTKVEDIFGTDDISTPVRMDITSDWKQVSTGSGHTCAINTSGQLFCWGWGRGVGKLGLGWLGGYTDIFGITANTPTRVGRADNWKQVSAGRDHTCAVHTSGELFCWGSNDDGQLGNYPYSKQVIEIYDYDYGYTRRVPFFTKTIARVGGASNWAQVSAGSGHTCAVNTSRQLWCWGRGKQLGLGWRSYTSSATRVGISDVMQVSAGSAHTCAIKTSGQLWCWGGNYAGQLGLGHKNSVSTPTRVGGASDWAQVSAGSGDTCAIKTSGQLQCWGGNYAGQLGLGSNTPTLVSGIALKNTVELNLTLNSNAGLPFAIANTAGNPTTCTAIPTTAGGNALDSYNLTVLVADGTCVIDSLNGNGPSRTLGGGSFTITASNGANITLTLNLRSPATPQIVTGRNRTYAINSARQLFGWGDNSENRLGLGDLEDSPPSVSAPTLLTGNDWEQVSAGKDHACAIKASGQLSCWGDGGSGQLGLGDNNSTNTPMHVGNANDHWMQVSAGGTHTCAINASRKLYCWGLNRFGQLGLGFYKFSYTTSTNTPTRVGSASNWAQVDSGGAHTCAVKTSGQLYCWGHTRNSRLGLDDYRGSTNAPRRVGSASDWAQVSAGSNHTCAIKASGQLFCWGGNHSGQLGLGHNNVNSGPTQVVNANDWAQVSANEAYTCAIKSDGQLFCWGWGSSGRLGLGDNSNTNTPTQAVGGASNWMQVSTGRSHTCAIKAAGQLSCWGSGSSGQLGLGRNTGANIPTFVPGIILRSVVELGLTLNSNAGLPFAIANTEGNPTTCTAVPITVSDDALDSYNLTVRAADGTCVIDSLNGKGPSKTLDGGSFTITASNGATTTLTLNLRSPATPQIVAGHNRTYAINSARQLFGWGRRENNSLNQSAPTLRTGNNWAQVNTGREHTCTINTSGQLFCWGDGGYGRLGLGHNRRAYLPTQVGNASDQWMQVSAGDRHTCAINTSGQLWCWGDGSYAQLGLGHNNSTSKPTRVGSASDWMQVSAGSRHTCAIDASRQLWCWGWAILGQLGWGSNSKTHTNTPTQVGGTYDRWTQVNAGDYHTCAIKTSGQLFCWGSGGNGRLGLGHNNSAYVPARVGSASDWAQVSTGNRHTCAIKTSGQLFCWGDGRNSRLGLDNNNSTHTPALAGGVNDQWTQVSAGDSHTCAIKTSGKLSCWGDGGNSQLGLGRNTSANTPTLVPGITLQSMVKLNLILNSNIGLPFTIANTGESLTTCTATPTIKGDDALDSYNLTVRVAGGTCVIDSLNGNGPSKTLDGGSFTIIASNGAPTILTLNLRTPAIPQIVAGYDRAYAINSARQLFGWGNNYGNRLGLNSGNPLSSISTPTLLAGNDWAQVSAGDNHTCAINASGQLFCWGSNYWGRLGLGHNNSANTPTQVGNASDWAQVSAGRDHTCAIKESGQLWCWGVGGSGRLGLGHNNSANTPTQVVGGGASGWMQVSVGSWHTCAISKATQLWCWGEGSSGKLGLGNNRSTNRPTMVGGASGWMQVSAGSHHTCGMNTAGQLSCWGSNFRGQLGLRNNSNANTPTSVGNNRDRWMQVSAGILHTCAIKTSGQLWCWGYGRNGRLGLGHHNSPNRPMMVGMASDWAQVNAGSGSTCAINRSGQLWCWGYGTYGRLGLGNNTSRLAPTRVPGFLLQ